jgi:hypothetical protein
MQVVVFHDDNDVHLPCPDQDRSLKYTLQDPPQYETSILHAVVTPLWIGRQPQISNQTLIKYETAYTRARIKLLKTFCAPSLRSQASQNFFWFIIADEATLQDRTIKRELVQSVQDHNLYQQQRPRSVSHSTMAPGNAYLMLCRGDESKTSPCSSLTGPKRLRWWDLVNQVRQSQLEILEGDMQQWDRARDQLLRDQDAVLMESMLYVDSGLHYRGIEWMQRVAMAQYKTSLPSQQQSALRRRSSSDTDSSMGPWFLCTAEHFEWHNPDIFYMKEKDYLDVGINIGRIGRRRATNGCPLAGLTVVSASSQGFRPHSDVTVSEGKDGLNAMPLCHNSASAVDCLLRVLFPMPLMVVGETVVSDNIELTNVQEMSVMGLTQEMDGPISFNTAEMEWQLLDSDFGVDRYDMWQTSLFLYEHTEEILRGHPCADDSGSNVTRCPTGAMNNLSELLKYVLLKTHQQHVGPRSKLPAMRMMRLEQAKLQADKDKDAPPKFTLLGQKLLQGG